MEFVARMHKFKGEGGWQEYTSLHVNFGGNDIQYETAYGELKMTVQPKTSSSSTYFLIPAVIHMNQGLPEHLRHSVDALEAIGVQSQLFLAFLERAFPSGPQQIHGRETQSIRLKKPLVVHFLQGTMEFGPPYEADITVNRISPHSIDFTIIQTNSKSKEGNPVKGIWSDEPRDLVMADSTGLDGWAVNYFLGATKILRDSASIHTLGDIREDLRFFHKRRDVESVKRIDTKRDADNLVSGYYLSPKPELISQLIDFIGRNEASSKATSIAPNLGFFSRIFADNPARHVEWKASIDRQQEKTRKLLMKALEHSPDQLIQELSISPARNDMWWGIFFASGDKKVIHSLIDQLEYLNEIDKPRLYSTAMTAKWSLAENARFYSTVKQLIEELREKGSLEMQQAAIDMLKPNPQAILDEYKAVAKSQKAKGVW